MGEKQESANLGDKASHMLCRVLLHAVNFETLQAIFYSFYNSDDGRSPKE
jgi:hypothetical protein